MQRFPTLAELASATPDAVLEHWAGLGYYARARNLHACARRVHTELGGNFPDTIDALSALPGIGRSTAGAILSIAYRQRAPILDGNVKRVLCRFFAIDTWPGERATETRLWQLADQLTPDRRVDDYTQAIMDLGATLCSRTRPNCPICPLQSHCRAWCEGRQNELPVARSRKPTPLRQTVWLHLENEAGEILLEKRPPSGIWGGLYSLPELEHGESIVEICRQRFGVEIERIEERESFVHVFSHFRLRIEPRYVRGRYLDNRVSAPDRFHWKNRDEIGRVGLPAPAFRYLHADSVPAPVSAAAPRSPTTRACSPSRSGD
jgi:A/G-specific adenine glycosylase